MADFNGLTSNPETLNLGSVNSFDGVVNSPPSLNLGQVISFGAVNAYKGPRFGALGSTLPIIKRTLYRGKVGPNYVYSLDNPPPGATNVIVVGITYTE